MERRPPPLTFFRSSLVTMRGRQSLTAPSLLSPCSLRSRLRRPMRHGGGRGAEEKVRGAEPSGGFAARRRKRAGRGYMLPLRQGSLPPMPEQRNMPRTEPSTRFYNRARGKERLTRRRSGWGGCGLKHRGPSPPMPETRAVQDGARPEDTGRQENGRGSCPAPPPALPPLPRLRP